MRTKRILDRAERSRRSVVTVVVAVLVSIVVVPVDSAVAATSSCPCSIWAASVTPTTTSAADTNAVELGVKFRSDVAGSITAIRFYKGAANTGTHVGSLWSRSGALLARATFTNESSTGWQQVTFSSPVAITAGTTYVASYHTSVGGYAVDLNYFTAAATDSPPLHALQSGVDGLNGVYSYSANPTFPTSGTTKARNYWVDVVFEDGVADSTAPVVTARAPAPGAKGVSASTAVSASFSEAVQPASVSFAVRDGAGQQVTGTSSYETATNTARFTPSAPLAASVTYTATVSGAADLAGNVMSPDTWSFTTAASSACPGGQNEIVCENSLPGNPPSQWDVVGAGSTAIQGFSHDISYAPGATAQFKINTPATDYRLDIYRMGYYGGAGARLVGTVQPSAALPQSQPACQSDTTTGLVDCGNWRTSAQWLVPTTAVSGIYFAKLVREDGTAGSSHVVFVVRDDTGGSDLLFQTSDTTWQAYNQYGGNSLYRGQPDGRAYKVSYNRPVTTRGTNPADSVFNAEYPMVRFLEANGYDVSYSTGVDTARNGAELLEHEVFLSVGHDEYWSGDQRAHVEAARSAGVHLAFFSGNEVFWKTRWESSITAPNTPFRTLVSYKESRANAKIDPNPAWTGTWRDGRFSPPSDGGRPENALTGTLFTVNGPRSDALKVPANDGRLRLWRNTTVASLAAGQVATFPDGTLGYEWDEDVDNGFRPPGIVRMSTSTYDVPAKLQDTCCTYAAGRATHHLTLYRHPSGALVFGAGTVQWSWGLDSSHDRGNAPADVRMQQATVNLLADMTVQPATLLPSLVPATPSTDALAPSAVVTSPAAGAPVGLGSPVTITGTANDQGGRVGGVEVSVDNGTTWHPAAGREAWTYSWTPTVSGPATIKARAVDDSANLGAASAVTVQVQSTSSCPCSIWAPSATPTTASSGDVNAVELGVKFRSDVAGSITGVRFYKGTANTGTHVGSLWSSTGTLLARATFTNESSSGWQQVTFSSPVAITAGTTYVASYHTNVGRYSEDVNYFATAGVDRPPLHALKSGVAGYNGVYAYGPTPIFPTKGTSKARNYWVDVVFQDNAQDTTPPSVIARQPAPGATGVSRTSNVSASFSEPVQPGSVSLSVTDAANNLVGGTTSYDAATMTATFDPAVDLNASTTYTARVSGATDIAGNTMAAPVSWSFTTASPSTYSCPCSIWAPSATPTTASSGDVNAVELGVKFRSDVAGSITGVRFYKGTANTGTHVGSLWSSTGTLLARATFTNESSSGWQQVTFSSPVAITAGTTYVASYHTNVGRYSEDVNYFATAGVDRPPLHALKSGVAGYNGVYAYGPTPIFPTNGSSKARNYWVDVVFQT